MNFTYYIPGLIESCLLIDSLLLSTLQCFYEDSYCFPTLINCIYPVSWYVLLPNTTFPVQPLVYDPFVSRFPPNTSMSIIAQELMIEQWHFSSSYQQFYDACAPIYCSYSEKVRKESFIGIIITVISMIGGVVVSLRILTPYLVKFISRFSIKSLFKKTKPEPIEQSNYLYM